MAGFSVDRPTLDSNIGNAIVGLRNAFDKVVHINQFLVNNPVPAAPGVDPLTAAPYSYTADEAYAIRLVFQNLATDYTTTQANNFTTASKFTGLM